MPDLDYTTVRGVSELFAAIRGMLSPLRDNCVLKGSLSGGCSTNIIPARAVYRESQHEEFAAHSIGRLTHICIYIYIYIYIFVFFKYMHILMDIYIYIYT